MALSGVQLPVSRHHWSGAPPAHIGVDAVDRPGFGKAAGVTGNHFRQAFALPQAIEDHPGSLQCNARRYVLVGVVTAAA
ncbi:MAG: hypothetical protein QOJ50_1719 [Cryptosporangiaceae bacterium]|nr:hypothetical protein [Cryptosporangiaceae bacterium]